MAVLQMVAVPFPPFLTPPGHPGGEGRGRYKLPTSMYSSPETQPLARRVGWGLRRVGWGLKEGWLGSEEGWLESGVSPGSIGCAYTYSGPFREAQISEQPLWGFPQVILIVPSHVLNNDLKIWIII
jgi:hypothetical protein